MPVCYITISSSIEKEDILKHCDSIRDVIANGLESRARLLDRNHIALRIQTANRNYMLGDIELDIFAQFFWRRFFSRDNRANKISQDLSNLLGHDCATWINLCQVGYSRFTIDGESFYSIKEDDKKIKLQRQEKNKI